MIVVRNRAQAQILPHPAKAMRPPPPPTPHIVHYYLLYVLVYELATVTNTSCTLQSNVID